MKSYRSLVYFAAATILLSVVGIQDASATTARRNSLAGNKLIEDRNDVYTYPQLAVNYANLIGFDYGAGAPEGSGLLIMGNKRGAFGISLHRGDLFNNDIFPYPNDNTALGNTTGPLAAQLVPAGTIFDLFGGFDVGGGLAGVRLALGNGSQTTTPNNADEDSNSQTFVVLQGGYSMTGALVLDTALNLSFATGSHTVGSNTPTSATEFGIGLNARGYAKMGMPWELGFLGNLNFQTTSTDNTAGNTTVTSSANQFDIQGGVGPVWDIGGDDNDSVVSGYAVLGYNHISNDPNTDQNNDANSAGQVILPGFQVAADIQLFDWLYFRSGAQYLWAINSTSQENVQDTSQHGSGFGWTAGVGFKKGNFRFDGQFANNFLLNGPNFIGGGNGFLTTASAEYMWE